VVHQVHQAQLEVVAQAVQVVHQAPAVVVDLAVAVVVVEAVVHLVQVAQVD